MTSIGMNLTGVSYYSTQEPFIDRAKTADVWRTTNSSISVDVNDAGNPVSIPSGANYIYKMVGVDPVAEAPIDTYVMTWQGSGTFSLAGAKILSRNGNQITFEVTNPDAVSVQLKLSNMNPGDPLHDLHVVRTDQVDLFKAGEIFNPTFVEKASTWDVLRFKDWGNIDPGMAVSWDDRSQVSDSTWAKAQHADGVPLEVMVRLANETGTAMWWNVPGRADDTYVKNALTYIRDNLDPKIKVHVEYSNEVWNWDYKVAGYAQDQAAALWGKDANGDGKINPKDGAELSNGAWMTYYGYRSAQVAQMVDEVFGSSADARTDKVLAGQLGNDGLFGYMQKGIAAAGGTASDLFDSYAVTTYFGNQLSVSDKNATNQAKVLEWARAGQAGMDAAFNELEQGGPLRADGGMSQLASRLASAAAVAKANGLDLQAYEGGAHLTAALFPSSMQGEVTDFFARLMNDPRMGDLYSKMAHSFEAAGGSTLVSYFDVGDSDKYGYWGVLDNIYKDGSPRYDALLAEQMFGNKQQDESTAGRPTQALVGTKAAEAIRISGTSQELRGMAGDDTLNGGSGNDTLNGGTGADKMIGAAGDDTYIVDNINDVVTEYGSAGLDTVITNLASYTLGKNLEALRIVAPGDVTGTGNELDNVVSAISSGSAKLYGMAGNDTLNGGNGDDFLDGGVGADMMAGGAGNDVYIVNDAKDVVTEAVNNGRDEVRTTLASMTLADNVEVLNYTGNFSFSGTGNALDNLITGGPKSAKLYGLAGNDTLVGGAMADTLDGGEGVDRMAGGNGSDTYYVGDANDVIVEAANEGNDTAYVSASNYTLADNVEKLIGLVGGSFHGNGSGNAMTASDAATALFGESGNDTLTGGAGNDTLDGGTGSDAMNGGAGNDVYLVDSTSDRVTELAGGGTDEVRTTLAKYTLGANVEAASFIGDGNFAGTGNTANNTLTGGAGDDTLNGGTGADRMVGGKGDDTYYVDDLGDVVVEGNDGGMDSIYATINYALPVNVEALILSGTAMLGLGHEGANAIQGNASANTLFGMGGDDTLKGMDGNDKLDGGAGNDILQGGNGNDTLMGSLGDDQLFGDAGSDVLQGGSGRDQLTGGAGADMFAFGPRELTASVSTTASILDFSRKERDQIDLSKLDAMVASSADDAFKFIGGASFNHKAGELRVQDMGNATYHVMGDTNGDGVADFLLQVTSKSGTLAAGDFVL
ncbi:calcium-binding protein [uncultured Sphingomonas sp.]|uniref:calcium-binding protein n=1 Tax=uncultured Sphingomonas sp. TaxID=158754 RepID=UPI0025F8CDC2|nr:calcium-binding protein [uncultured Sphingomonas sp.]